jgi:hypothetical protein
MRNTRSRLSAPRACASVPASRHVVTPLAVHRLVSSVGAASCLGGTLHCCARERTSGRTAAGDPSGGGQSVSPTNWTTTCSRFWHCPFAAVPPRRRRPNKAGEQGKSRRGSALLPSPIHVVHHHRRSVCTLHRGRGVVAWLHWVRRHSRRKLHHRGSEGPPAKLDLASRRQLLSRRRWLVTPCRAPAGCGPLASQATSTAARRPDLANSFWRGVRTYTCIHAGIGYMIRPACPEHDRSVGIYIIATRSRPAGHGPSDLDGYCVRRAVPDRVRHACRPSMQMDCRRWLRAPEMRDMIWGRQLGRSCRDWSSIILHIYIQWSGTSNLEPRTVRLVAWIWMLPGTYCFNSIDRVC